MKKSNQNSLVRDFIGAAFCLMMAFALLMMYSGCSEDNSPINGAHGGAAEEQGYYALSGRVGDVAPKVMRLRGIESASDNNGVQLDASKAATVAVYELDSLTLEATGRVFVDTIENADGKFSFKGISLKSPYALVEIQDSCIGYYCRLRGVWGSLYDSTKHPISLSAIVDVRKHQELSANSLSYLKIPLVKKYFAEGMSFAEASKKAEQDVLASLGIYEDLGDFESLESVNGELSYVLQMMAHVTRVGVVFQATLPSDLNTYYGVPPAAVAALGEKAEKLYSNTIKLLEYEIGYYVLKYGVGLCTSERENETYAIGAVTTGVNSLVCHSGKWIPGGKKVEYTSGMMMDARDGKNYKTVTYNWNGVTQTWMAENLNYADTTSSKADSALKANLLGSTRCWDGDPNCELFGRYYTWGAAANLGLSDFKMTGAVTNLVCDETNEGKCVLTHDTVAVEDRCKAYKDEVRWLYDEALVNDAARDLCEAYKNQGYLCEELLWSEPVEYCSVKSTTGECLERDTANSLRDYCLTMYSVFYLDASNIVSDSGAAYQGVCPEGWRLPSRYDWFTLLQNVLNQGATLYDSYGTGFGYTDMMTLEFVDADVPEFRIANRVHYSQAAFIMALDAKMKFYEGRVRGLSHASDPVVEDSRPWNVYTQGNVGIDMFKEEAPVRCIKN